MVQYLWKIVWQCLRKLSVKVPHDPAIAPPRFMPKIIEKRNSSRYW